MYKRVISVLISLILLISIFPISALENQSQKNAFETTVNVNPLLTDVVLEGVALVDGKYQVEMGKPYHLKLSFQENDALEMDMNDHIYFELPAGIVPVATSGTIEIGVMDYSSIYHPIYHDYTIEGSKVTIHWNTEDENFKNYLAYAHGVQFVFGLSSSFDGTQSVIKFGTENEAVINVDNSGSATIKKVVVDDSGNAVVMNESQMKEMKFKLYGPDGFVKEFTYFDMAQGTITYTDLVPGEYRVIEEAYPVLPDYTYDSTGSVKQFTVTLEPGQSVIVPLSNIYKQDKGSLEIQKSVSGLGDNISESVKKQIEFTVTDKDGNTIKTVNYSQFTNGKLVIGDLPVGQYTVTETNKVTGYTCTYKVNGSPVNTPTANVTVRKNQTSSVSFENTYEEETADLIIRKTASGATVPADTLFTVTSDKGYKKTFTYAEMTVSANGRYYKIDNLPLGVYTVTESSNANVASYSLAVSGTGNVELSEKDGVFSKVIHNEYTPVGSLEVKKTISIQGGTLTDALKTEFRNVIAFEVFNSSNQKVGSLTYGDILDGKGTLTDLPVGTYTVKETASTITGYTMLSAGTQTKVVEVKHNNKADASFTNTYEKDVYKLSLNKVFGAGSAYNSSNLPNSIKNGTKFTITDANGNKVTIRDASGTAIGNPVSYSQVVGGLDLYLDGPGPYTVTESNPNVSGVAISTEVSSGGAYAAGTSAAVQLVRNGSASVTFRNTYTQLAKIKGDKTIVGLTSNQQADVKAKITFTITRTDVQSTPITVTLAQLQAGIEVPVGTYKVQENTDTANVSGYSTTVTVKVGENGTVINSASTGNFDVEHNETVSVFFTNTYGVEGDNGLGLIKTVEGLDGVSAGALDSNSDLYKAITFTLQEKTAGGSWRLYNNYTLAQLSAGIDLPVGTYRIAEKNADVSGYSLKVTYRVGNSAWKTGPLEFSVTKDTRVTVAVHNAYTKLGSLKITKFLNGLTDSNLTDAQKQAIVFTVTHSSGTPVYTVKYSDFTNGSYTLNNIPVGTYTVTEAAADTPTYKLVSVVSSSQNGSVNVLGGNTQASINFTNTYERKTGSLTVVKSLNGINQSLTDAQKGAMTFTLKDQSGAIVHSVRYSDFVNGSYTFKNLPTGVYSVDETIGNALSASYNVTVTGKNTPVTVNYNETARTEITNNFTAIGYLKLVKSFGSSVPDAADIKFEIRQNGQTVKTVNFSDFVYDNATESYYYTVNKLPVGVYTVVEQDNTTGYKKTSTVKVGNGNFENGNEAELTVELGSTASVEFKNTYTGDPTIKLKKTVAGLTAGMTEEQLKAITFTVTSDNGYSNTFTYFDMTDGEMVLSNLRPGNYTVTETVDNEKFRGYTCVTQYTIGSDTQKGTSAVFAADHGEYEVTFTNTYAQITPLNVEKDCIKDQHMLVTDDASYPIWRFTLTISNMNPNTTYNGTTAFTDVFDETYAEWFRLATDAEVQQVFGSDEKSVYIKPISTGDAPEARFDIDHSQIVISGITEDTAQTCEFVYYLIVKDKSALEEINRPASENADSVLHNFRNVVTYKPMPYSEPVTTEAEYEYKFVALDKDIVNLKDGKLVATVGGKEVLVNYADYSVILNENAVTIGNQAEIIAVDNFSANQTILYDSIVTNPAVSFELDNVNHTIKFRIPNSTRVEVFYRAAIANSDNDTISLTNSIQLNGFVVDVEEEAQRNVVGSGLAKVYAVKVFKVDAKSSNKQLENVVFDLYDGTTNQILTSATTNDKGAIVFASWTNDGLKDSIRPDHDYYIVERSTVPGYNLLNEPVKFRLSDSVGAVPGVDQNGVHVLVAGTNNELIVANEPVVATLQAAKDFEGWSREEWNNASFKFALKDENHNTLQTVTVTKDNPVAVFSAIHYENITDEDVANNKVVTYKYYIQEVVKDDERIDGIFYDTTEYPVTVTISAGEQNGTKKVDVDYGEYQALSVVNYESISIPVHKVWNDNKNQDGIRPGEITVKLLANGQDTGKSLVLNAGNNWQGTFTDLYVYEEGQKINYTVEEVGLPRGYEPEIGGSAENGYVITNTHIPETVEVSGEKNWVDDENRDGVRPTVITIHLLKNGQVINTKQVTKEDNWSWSFNDLPKYENGQLITYTITEDAVQNYSTEYDGYNVNNTHIPGKTSVSVLKVWNDNNDQDGFRSKSVTVTLLANGKDTGKTLVLDADNNWQGSFTDLYVYEAGQKITYTIEETEVPEGYESVISGSAENGYTVTNSHTPETVEVSGTKSWADDNNRDGVRPNAITIRLLKNGQVVNTKQVTKEDNWSWSFTDLPKYEGGELITYTITEDAVENYSTEYDGFNVINGYTPGKTSVSVLKVWEDNNNQDGIRVKEITVKLLANGKDTGKTLVLSDDNDWSGTFTDLYVYEAGQKITYTIEEIDAPEGYVSVISGDAETRFIITNTHIPETTEISGQKSWVDDNDRDGMRPDAITVNLLSNGELYASKTVTEEDNWSWTFTDLPKYQDGVLINYTVTEDAVENYRTEYNGNNIVNTHIPERTEVNVLKVWDDNNNQDGFRGKKIIVKLLANGKDTGKSLVLNADNDWSGSFTDLYVYEDGEVIVYTIKESNVPEGYESVIRGSAESGYTVTNTHIPETVEVSGTKSWVDDNNRDGIRPTVITVNLLKNGKVIDTKQVTAENNWSWAFTDLPKYEGGKLINYTIEEDAVENYSTEYDSSDIINTHIPERTEVNVLKVWDDNNDQDGFRAKEITVKLLANGKDIGKSLVLNANNGWSGSFTDLYVYANGQAIVYTIEEVEVPEGYESVISGNAENGYTVTNTHTPETVEVSGTKSWVDDNNRDGVRPDTITIHLLKNGEVIETVEVTEQDNWSWSFTDLPKYESGVMINYTVEEDAVENYSTQYSGYNVVNTHIPERTEVSVLKVWDDNNDQDGFRAEEITVKLLKNGEDTGMVLVLNAENNWSGSFTDLYVYEDGEAIVYTIEEVEVPEGYESVISGDAESGYTVTNTHTPETVEVSGEKNWDDDDDRDGIRPTVITIHLLKNGEVIETIDVTEEDLWSWSFTDLPKYENGELITYTIMEDAVENYSTQYDGYNVTNGYTPGKTSVSVLKVWNDNNDQKGIRPEEITVKLLANSQDTDMTLVLNAENNWSGSFTDLYMYKMGEKIVYTVEEIDTPKGYTSSVKGSATDGFVVTNTKKPETPETGDNSDIALLGTLLTASVLTAFAAYRKKEEN